MITCSAIVFVVLVGSVIVTAIVSARLQPMSIEVEQARHMRRDLGMQLSLSRGNAVSR
jgi:hypothetical protein